MTDDRLIEAATATLEACRAAGLTVATAESCTGGLVAASLVAIAGSSDVVECGFVTYSNAAKSKLVGVAEALIAANGAVSEPVARAMAEGALRHSDASVAVAVTGIAGPTGGTPTKPVGLVHFACARIGRDTAAEYHVFDGDRTAVRRQATLTALSMIERMAGR